jgi:hypothetical protein
MNIKCGGAEVFSANLAISVADPDPTAPHVFGPPEVVCTVRKYNHKNS